MIWGSTVVSVNVEAQWRRNRTMVLTIRVTDATIGKPYVYVYMSPRVLLVRQLYDKRATYYRITGCDVAPSRTPRRAFGTTPIHGGMIPCDLMIVLPWQSKRDCMTSGERNKPARINVSGSLAFTSS
ncbi:hypothetical protein M422DRAFT_272173 [Sphaerobolus stellatus SS14]|uniref:Uncharacterized protein n=1 Tax=Sphaerobolus stellatus (strain SS14) TaxID=990650 RepID=A0A0C9TY01_SPHS4|nr:hypothetical protein M422DRAFT_272173 [Sphaerobolus stellatus SS14]